MGVFVYLPLVLPLTALPVARLAAHHLHPRSATRLLAVAGTTLALCSTLCLALLMVIGTAQLPGNPLPDGWSDPQVRAALPYEDRTGLVAIGVLGAVVAGCAQTLVRHVRTRVAAARALEVPERSGASAVSGTPETSGAPAVSGDGRDRGFGVRVVESPAPYAYALPGGLRRRGEAGAGRVVVSSALLGCLEPAERQALFAHERAHLAGRHHRYLLLTQLAARANPFLVPLRTAVAYSTERWADEEAARVVGSRHVVARAVGKAALVSTRSPFEGLAGFSAAGPVPRRVAALLDPAPPARFWPPASAHLLLAGLTAAVGTTASALSSVNATVSLVRILHAATPL
ncbi:M56 family metallopeptidase [Streptomyces sp. NBC_00102]|uniref:M56 family metallopeptidase n=1 Tax=Streptomyces sp. NBC_00102 TaxID=2975652 RepID=UPI0022500199|nr:M56 family metallopeptidase [Streptomyces sp. NBC_00102]MCX5398415.1 M56 family metallopeptidase [Streptomyces sp. NBC_00102]